MVGPPDCASLNFSLNTLTKPVSFRNRRFMWILSIKLLIVGAVFIFFVLIFGASIFEKQMLRQFVPVDGSLLKDPSPYYLAVNESVRNLGFLFVGTFQQSRNSKVYRAFFSLWMSADGGTLVRVVGGKTLSVGIRRTILTNDLADGGIIESSDEFISPDLSGLFDRRILVRAHFEELLGFHQERLASLGVESRRFNAATAFQVYETFEAMRAERLEEMGLAQFINVERSVWRYTIKGAFRNYAACRGEIKKSSEQSKRIRLKRPGDT
jgi:hypothetical protein